MNLDYPTLVDKIDAFPDAEVTDVLAWHSAELAFRNEPTDGNLAALKRARLRAVGK